MAKYFYILIFLFYISSLCFAQTRDLQFEHISIENGLSSNQVYSILQDSKGFMWFATDNGLHKYDGYKFTIYTQDPDKPYSISHNFIYSIYEDRFGNLWIGTYGGGLNKFDREKEQFIHFKHELDNIHSLPDNYVLSIHEDRDGDLWIGTYGGLSHLSSDQVSSTDNEGNVKFIHYKYKADDPNSLSYNKVSVIFEDQSGLLWIGTSGGGLNKFDKNTGTFTRYKQLKWVEGYWSRREFNCLIGNHVYSIYEDSADSGKTLWIGTDQRLNKFDQVNNKFITFYYNENDPNSISSNHIESIYKTGMGLFLIGTIGGLHIFDTDIEKFIQYKHEPDNPKSISHNRVSSIYEDHTGVIWIGTVGNGANRYDKKKQQFEHFTIDLSITGKKKRCSVTAIHEDYAEERRILWLGIYSQGLIKYSRETGQIKQYRKEFYNHSNNDYYTITSILQDADDTDIIWIGTWGGGLYKFDKKSEIFTSYNYPTDWSKFDIHNFSSKVTYYIKSIFRDKSGSLWITTTRGFYKFDRGTKEYTPYHYNPAIPNSLSHNNVISICEDSIGNIWLGTDDGLNKFDPKAGTFYHYKNNPADSLSVNSNTITSIYTDQNGILWVGTNQGLNKFNPATKAFTRYMKKNGLLGVEVMGILGDKHGNLWLNTFKGLIKFDPRTEFLRNYDEKDGFQGIDLNRHAYHRTKSGEMFFGGPKGINAFYPDSIKDNPHIPRIVLTDFQLFNKSVKPGNDSPLKKAISEIDEIILSHDQFVCSFEFAALDYTTPEKNLYAYKMEGVNPDWVYTDASRRFATYTQLDPGEYTFRVKGSNNDGLWNEIGTSVKIIITPPWWKTWWAYSLYTLFLVLTLYALRRYDLKRQKLKHELAVEHLHAEKLEEVDRMKSRFFANISHEFRTPLTLILGPVKQMLSGEFRGNFKEQFKIIVRNGERLLLLINQLLNLSKLESGKLKLQVQSTDIITLLKGLVQAFESLAVRKKISLKFKTEIQSQEAYIDHDKFENIINNLLSNAFKFTPEGGKIVVDVCIVQPPLSPFSGAVAVFFNITCIISVI